MKKVLLCLAFISISAAMFAQPETPKAKHTKAEYLNISKSQRVTAWILLGCGAVAFAIIAPGNVDFSTLGVVFTIGTIATLGSIPLFIAAARNKRKARAMSASIGIQRMNPIVCTSRYSGMPSVSIRLNL